MQFQHARPVTLKRADIKTQDDSGVKCTRLIKYTVLLLPLSIPSFHYIFRASHQTASKGLVKTLLLKQELLLPVKKEKYLGRYEGLNKVCVCWK